MNIKNPLSWFTNFYVDYWVHPPAKPARDVARNYEALDQVVGAWPARQPCVGGLFFTLFSVRMEADAIRPPLLKSNQIERTPQRP
jgi:hypothetical protein